MSYAIRGQPDFLDTGVLYNEGLEASILAIADRGYQGTLKVLVTYFDTLASPGPLNLTSVFEVGILAPGWTLTIENYGDPNDFPFLYPLTAHLLESESFANSGTATRVSAFDNPGGYFSLTTIFTIYAPTPGLLTATARITAEDAAAAIPEPTSLTLVAAALAALVPCSARRGRRAT